MDIIITLTTDFGVRDPYVAEMKGAILGIARAAGATVQLVDVTHEVARHDVVEGALALEAAAPFFPRGTVHVAVIDPGVGTARRGIAVAARDQVFIGPDNGVFTPFLSGRDWRAFELAVTAYRLPAVSRTFHGRDLFAPAAAHVAVGVDVARLGPALTDPVRLAWDRGRERAGTIEGAVIHVDRFGNLGLRRAGLRRAGLRRARFRRVGFRRAGRRRGRGGGRSVARGRVGLLLASARRRFLRRDGLLPRLGGIVGDVPAAALEDERRWREQAMDLAPARLARRQRRS